ncbi:hypothetical protein FIBSPDRAFT_760073, partial [Athelia psychrophila]
WDAAVSSLALSCKVHRDVLAPLCPVYACEYLAIVPHSISLSELEASQRDVLQALDYSLGHSMPQAFLDELWCALPSLRALLAFEGGWEMAQRETWERLFDLIPAEPDVLRFPVSLMTAPALMAGVLLSVIAQHWLHHRSLDEQERDAEYAEWIHIDLEADDGDGSNLGEKNEDRERGYVQRAIDASVDVLQDLRDVVGIDNVSCLSSDTPLGVC